MTPSWRMRQVRRSPITIVAGRGAKSCIPSLSDPCVCYSAFTLLADFLMGDPPAPIRIATDASRCARRLFSQERYQYIQLIPSSLHSLLPRCPIYSSVEPLITQNSNREGGHMRMVWSSEALASIRASFGCHATALTVAVWPTNTCTGASG